VRPILLDTCALIWLANRDRLAPAALAALEEVSDSDGLIAVSPISAWEIGQLAARGRLTLTLAPEAWFQAALDGGLTLAPMPPELLIASSFLPSARLRDPADRIIAATARLYRYRLMTRDGPLLAFGHEGHVETIAC
jgi:PIN domain nuclease of toxin-antitoxin system